MFRRVIACLVLGMWLGLLGVEFSEELGLFVFTNEDTDQAADDALASLGQALRSAGHPYLTVAQRSPPQLAIVQSLDDLPAFEPLVLSHKHRLAEAVPKRHIPIYKLYLDFRI